MNNLVTIFTPTYNRAHTLPKLYESLGLQEKFNFEWLIVDDGSEDNTEELVRTWVLDSKFPITYEKKLNEGKHIAINKGVQLSKLDLFFIVDSDDYLLPNATQLIEQYYAQIKNNTKLAGVSFRRGTDEQTVIGSAQKFDDLQMDVFYFRYNKKIGGDMAEVYKTAILKKFPFPKFENERFCAESLVWNRIGLQYQLLWTSHIVYICNYLEGGLTSRMFEIRKKSPKAATLYYSEFMKLPIPLKDRLKGNINYWRFAKFLQVPFIDKIKQSNSPLSLLGFPLSLVFLLKDKK